MALEDYRRKRDFTKSPEPTGDATKRAGAGGTRFFCVQKHLASHLHYDFRIEHNGVLLSWAVPKGPSLDPKVKRLAMHVEDHPYDYGTFEGVIPEGYGAGIVMLWDTGTWTPEVDDIDAALAKGDLKFSLDGYKLKGSWALIRTRGYGSQGRDGRSWLLIKHRDDWAGPVDITTFAPRSVKSDQDFPEILAADQPAIWETNRPVNGGETGALLKDVIAQAAAIKAGRARPATPAAKVRATTTSAGREARNRTRRATEPRPTKTAATGTARTKAPARRRKAQS